MGVLAAMILPSVVVALPSMAMLSMASRLTRGSGVAQPVSSTRHSSTRAMAQRPRSGASRGLATRCAGVSKGIVVMGYPFVGARTRPCMACR